VTPGRKDCQIVGRVIVPSARNVQWPPRAMQLHGPRHLPKDRGAVGCVQSTIRRHVCSISGTVPGAPCGREYLNLLHALSPPCSSLRSCGGWRERSPSLHARLADVSCGKTAQRRAAVERLAVLKARL